jgi:UDPglucose 6-dehydrogenase
VRVCVFGLWHLGCVTAACVAEHFPTWACDPDPSTIANLEKGIPPIREPSLQNLIEAQMAAQRLFFTSEPSQAIPDSDLVWITFDTPVNDDDVGDAEVVARQIRGIFPLLSEGAVVLISSQVPAGFTAQMESEFRRAYPHRDVGFAYSPENLRLGASIDGFRRPDRIVIGVRNAENRARLEELMARFSTRLEWMSVESAEMTKHALNAFLAASIAFINEIASVAESVGADGKEIERGLKSDSRIGPRSYLSPGAPFGGGTLGRDVSFLAGLAANARFGAPLLQAIRPSNEAHKEWTRRELRQLLGDLRGKTVAVLGLTYKPGTNTLRRSVAVELCRWISAEGGRVQAYDPAIPKLSAGLQQAIHLCGSMHEALRGADALVVATEWPEFKKIGVDDLETMRGRVVADPNRFLNPELGKTKNLVYSAVGSRGSLR